MITAHSEAPAIMRGLGVVTFTTEPEHVSNEIPTVTVYRVANDTVTKGERRSDKSTLSLAA